jgi:hypothetical protein
MAPSSFANSGFWFWIQLKRGVAQRQASPQATGGFMIDLDAYLGS